MARVSVREVAVRAGVSTGTVTNVLNRPERVSREIVDRVAEAIDALGFVLNDAARQLRAGRSRSIGLVVLDIGNPFFASLARAVEDESRRHDLSLLIASSDGDPEREGAYLDLFEQQRVRGVLIFPTTGRRGPQRPARTVRTVVVGRPSENAAVASASVDDVAGGRLAADHLLAIGRRRLLFVGGTEQIQQVADRLRGARSAVSRCPGASLRYLATCHLSVAAGRGAGDQIIDGGTSSRPDGVLAANDLVAFGLLQAFEGRSDARVPHDIALIGYDDTDFASLTAVSLSTIRQPIDRIGPEAVQMLWNSSEAIRPRQMLYQPPLVVRQSTAVGPMRQVISA
jgi:LacI family transcriptional regulator